MPIPTIFVAVDEEMHELAKRAAAIEGRTVAGYVRALLSADFIRKELRTGESAVVVRSWKLETGKDINETRDDLSTGVAGPGNHSG